MRVIETRNAHSALPQGIGYLLRDGVERPSRNGPVLLAPTRVATVYQLPMERVVFWTQRDYNPFFALYEALWMIAGRNDVAPLKRYVKTFDRYSDDGATLHGAYGYRWRTQFGFDQIPVIARRLKADPNDRRSVLQMWDAPNDLDRDGADVPCNDIATFQISHDGKLDLTVLCRSNDIVWGAYYANAYHFGLLLEYMAAIIGCPVGVYTQISVNYHAYLTTLEPVRELPRLALGLYATPGLSCDPYRRGDVVPIPMVGSHWDGNAGVLDEQIRFVLAAADSGFPASRADAPLNHFFMDAWDVLKAHEVWRTLAAPARFDLALLQLGLANQLSDVVVSATQWIRRRQKAWEEKQ